MEAFIVSTFVVAIGEIGDKTQLLALLLSARFRRPVPIVLGILVATLANHAIAGALGEWVRSAVDPKTLQWTLGISFIALAAWALKPDQYDPTRAPRDRYGVFLVTLCAFFLAEMGDKTQIATVALAAEYHAYVSVVAGTTLAFARSLGEYGSVVFIAGNMPMQTEIAPLRVLSHLESYDYAAAAIVAVEMLVASAGLLLIVNVAQRRIARPGTSSA